MGSNELWQRQKRFKIPHSWKSLFVVNRETLFRIFDTIIERSKRSDVSIIPNPFCFFKSFEMCNYNRLKVIILSQEPYGNIDYKGYSFANGIAFSVSGDEITPSLSVIKKWLNSCYPETEHKIFDKSLIPWCLEGVLLLNASLTVEFCRSETVKVSHRKLWESFIRSCLHYCGTKKNRVFVLMGNIASDYDDSIPEDNHIIRTVHPAYVARNKTVDSSNNFFLEVNRFLERDSIEPINWCSVFH